jgi:hypothetical protein
VWHLHAGVATLFVDDSTHAWIPNVPVAELVPTVHVIYVHSVYGVAGTCTDFGVPPVMEDKQLILVGNRARRFTAAELFRLGGDHRGLDELRAAVRAPVSQLRRKHGKSLTMPLADAIVTRLRARIDEFISVQHGHMMPYRERPEPLLAPQCVALADAGAVVVFIMLADRETRALINTSSASLPGVTRGSVNDLSHRTVVGHVDSLTALFESTLGAKPEALRVSHAEPDNKASAHVVACPLGDEHERSYHRDMRWLTLHEIGALSSDLHRVVSLTLACVGSQQTHK